MGCGHIGVCNSAGSAGTAAMAGDPLIAESKPFLDQWIPGCQAERPDPPATPANLDQGIDASEHFAIRQQKPQFGQQLRIRQSNPGTRPRCLQRLEFEIARCQPGPDATREADAKPAAAVVKDPTLYFRLFSNFGIHRNTKSKKGALAPEF